MPDLAEIIKQTGKVLSGDAALLKREQIYLCHSFSGQKLKDIGLQFGIVCLVFLRQAGALRCKSKTIKNCKKRLIKSFQNSACQLCTG